MTYGEEEKKKTLFEHFMEKKKNKPKYDIFIHVEDTRKGLQTYGGDLTKLNSAHKEQVISFLMGMIQTMIGEGQQVAIVQEKNGK